MGLTSYLTDEVIVTGSRQKGNLYRDKSFGPVILAIILSPAVPGRLYAAEMKLCQGQVWKQGKEYIRIVRLERLEVEYKSLLSLANKKGTLHATSKKDFCRLLKGAKLLTLKPTPLSEEVAE
jgi:hypothetical protein